MGKYKDDMGMWTIERTLIFVIGVLLPACLVIGGMVGVTLDVMLR